MHVITTDGTVLNACTAAGFTHEVGVRPRKKRERETLPGQTRTESGLVSRTLLTCGGPRGEKRVLIRPCAQNGAHRWIRIMSGRLSAAFLKHSTHRSWLHALRPHLSKRRDASSGLSYFEVLVQASQGLTSRRWSRVQAHLASHPVPLAVP